MNISTINTRFKDSPRLKKFAGGVLICLIALGIFFYTLKLELEVKYDKLRSVVIQDRNGLTIAIKPNAKGNYSDFSDALPERLKQLLVKKEDRFFYFHAGINPVSVVRAITDYLKSDTPGASSTITQQLAKNLLGNEQSRTLENKIIEMFYTGALELFFSKGKILTMYQNTVYMGNQIQGINLASLSYFGKKTETLTDTEILSLLATLSSPTGSNPWKSQNLQTLKMLGKRLGVASDTQTLAIKKSFKAISSADFELETLGTCAKSCNVTLDKNLTDSLREILVRNLALTSSYGGRNGAIVVIKLPENELLAIVGTPDTRGGLSGSAINMATEPRPIGSTVKPFIYLKAFEKGLRPYTLVDDREYKFSIANGFPLYPKNYDGAYRGSITLHEALSNSLNVPTVKTLEYVILADFYYFLEQSLQFKPLQPLESYQYGIALGGLEMDPLTLAHYFTIFGNNGELKPLKLFEGEAITPPMEKVTETRKIADESYVQLVNKIISDRLAGVEQFGLAGNLNLPETNYAVKTGTSRDFHDTWTVGFTPDFLVAVWLGNAENEPMRQITSASGAGKIWHDSMELMMSSSYNQKTQFNFSKIVPYEIDGKLEFGLPGDDINNAKNLLAEKSLILKPHDGDTFEFQANTEIKLEASRVVRWYANDRFLGENAVISFHPETIGAYIIRAAGSDKEESATIRVVQN